MRTALRSWVIVAALVVAALVAGASPAGASGTLRMTASINGQALSGSGSGDALKLYPDQPATVAIQVVNSGDQPVTIRSVDLTGRVIGLTFYSFQTSVSLTVGAGSQASLSFLLDLTGLRGQATGLIPASLELHDGSGRTVAAQGLVSDVRGSIASVYGLFGLVVLALTILAICAVLLALARHRLPTNRWMRGLRFLTPGLGIGLVIVFTFSALRVFVPRATTWILVLVISGAVLFVVGYLSPSPVDEDDDEDDDEEDDEDGEDGDVAVPSGAAPVGATSRETRRASPSETEQWPGPPR